MGQSRHSGGEEQRAAIIMNALCIVQMASKGSLQGIALAAVPLTAVPTLSF